MIINHGGKAYDIQNWVEFEKQLMFLLANEIEKAIQDEAMKMGLFIDGTFIRGIRAQVKDGKIVVSSDAAYGAYLEYGTYEFGFSFSEDSWPTHPFPKKKDISWSARQGFPRGMQPFAPFRRIMYSQNRMNTVIKEAFA